MNDIYREFADPDGSKRLAEEELVNNLPSNAVTAIAGMCTVLSAGQCAYVFGGLEIATEASNIDYENWEQDYKLGKPAMGLIGLGVSDTIADMPGFGSKGKVTLDVINFLYGLGFDAFVDNIESEEVQDD
ncbi:hypothetical protein [Vibrio sonorensis]|uniref:hypothetical protein n=1 Tax=Vibrio sonorensis TaxID=1004316 RepID=UPI0008DB0DAD|nr:hypothetical protein [Vibrio sonorensis]